MTGQLVLIPTSAADWRLDERTRETGRKGVAAAREILRLADERARRRAADTTHPAGTARQDAPTQTQTQPAA
jgi:hypothetical protein